MSWAKVDDRANEHPKLLDAGLEASALWLWGLLYANRQDARDGFIPERALPMLYPLTAEQLVALPAKLVEVKLWDRVKGGYRVHNFLRWNATKEQLDARRNATRNRVAKHRGNATGNAVTENG